MSRKKEMRAKREADKKALDADFASRPIPKFPSPPPPAPASQPPNDPAYLRNPVEWLAPRPWFDPEQIRFQKLVRQDMGESDFDSRFACLLRNYGFGLETDSDHVLVRRYYSQLTASIWPKDLANDIWNSTTELDQASVDRLLRFLENTPYVDGSSYALPLVAKRLRGCNLNQGARLRIAQYLERNVQEGSGCNRVAWLRFVDLADPGEAKRIVEEGLRNPLSGCRMRATQLGLVLTGHTERLGFLSRSAGREEWNRAKRRICTHFGWQETQADDLSEAQQQNAI